MTDRDEKGDEMTDRMSRRFGSESESTEETENTQETKSAKNSQSSKNTMNTQTTQTDKSEETSESAENVNDRPSVLMYLPENQKEELSLRFDELNLKHKRQHGEALGKNRDYYPAVVEAALNGDKTLEEILGVDE